MPFNAKLFLSLLVVVAFACKQNTKPQHTEQDTTTANNETENPDTVSKVVVYAEAKRPCQTFKPVTAAYKSESTNGFGIKITPICLEDYGVQDTLFGNGDTIPITVEHNYKHKVVLTLYKDSVEYFITKEDIPDSKFLYNLVLVKPNIIKYLQKDTSVFINFLLGRPDTDDVSIQKFKISYNNGVKYIGVEAPNYNDPIYDANAN